LESFYEQLSLSTSQQPFSATSDASKSILLNVSIANASSFHHTVVRPKGIEGDGEVRRHVERLLLRLDFNGGFSNAGLGGLGKGNDRDDQILRQGGLT
jgi:gamma-tubulin complex component 4